MLDTFQACYYILSDINVIEVNINENCLKCVHLSLCHEYINGRADLCL